MPRPALASTALLALATAASVAVAIPASATTGGHPGSRVSTVGHRPSSGRTTGVDPAALARRSGKVITPLRRGTTTGTLPRRVLDPRAATLRAGRNGKVTVSVAGASATVASRVRDLGGQVLATSGGVSSVLVAKSGLNQLAHVAGITAVRAPVRPHTAAGPTSEGVQASQANAWQAAGTGGSGVVIGIVDAGFTGLADAQTAGDLPTGITVVNEDCVNGGAPSTDTSEHGTAVAEIAHQMAPAAQLRLYCVGTNIGFAAASSDIQAYNADSANLSKIKIVSSSLGFSDDGRGDGTGATTGDGVSTAYAVQQARRSGILWIQSAGNNAENHWSGTLADADNDGFVDIDGVYDEDKNQYEQDESFVAPGSPSAPTSADIELQWDQWPTTNAAVTLEAYGFQCTTAYQKDDGSCGEYPITADANGTVHKVPGAKPVPTPTTVQHTSGGEPYAEIDMTNTSVYGQYWVVDIQVNTAYPTTRYDLTYQGDVDGPSFLACANPDCTSISPRSYQGSVSAPASSPYALAVGAADVGADGVAKGTLEPFSSQGPTIDGRVKPDITGWDGVSSPVYGAASTDPNIQTGFYGTSAAAPHVAGAAALALQSDPSLDAAQLQTFLEQRAGTGKPNNPPTNQVGHGLLTLGTPPAGGATLGPAGSQYAAQTPARVLDTRAGKLPAGHKGALKAGGTVTVPVNVPDGTTAVAINLTGVGATATTYLTTYPAGSAAPKASNLNLSKADPLAAVFAVVAVGTAKSITIRNYLGSVDVIVDQLGYFGTDTASTDLYTAPAQPIRAIDTRTTKQPVLPGKGVTITPKNAPAGATAAVVNVTVTNTTGVGYVNASAQCSTASSTVNFAAKGATRANLAIVKLAPNHSFCVSDAQHSTDLVVDVVGYMGSTGSQYHPLPSSTRIIDTRTGNGGSAGGHPSKALAANTNTVFYGANVGDVPASATALLTGLVEASATTTGYLELFPGAAAPANPTSNLNFTATQTVPNAAIVGVPENHEFGIHNGAGSTQAVVDLFGYFAPAPVPAPDEPAGR